MQKKFSFERLLPRVPELTERDCGELATNNPPLPCGDLAHRLKAYWAAGMKQGKMAKITGRKKDYIKKFTACFSRALTPPPPGAYLRKVAENRCNKVVFEIARKNVNY